MYLGAQDVLAEDMVISGKTNAPLNIVISTQAATVQGEVSQNKGGTVRATVLLAPSESKFRGVTSFYRFVASDEKGHYEMKGLSPGKYRMYAMEEFDPAYLQDADLLKPLEPASVFVELQEGVAATQNLKLLPRPGANQGANE